MWHVPREGCADVCWGPSARTPTRTASGAYGARSVRGVCRNGLEDACWGQGVPIEQFPWAGCTEICSGPHANLPTEAAGGTPSEHEPCEGCTDFCSKPASKFASGAVCRPPSGYIWCANRERGLPTWTKPRVRTCPVGPWVELHFEHDPRERCAEMDWRGTACELARGGCKWNSFWGTIRVSEGVPTRTRVRMQTFPLAP